MKPTAELLFGVVGHNPASPSPRGQSPLLWAALQRSLSRLATEDTPGQAHHGLRVLDCGGGSGSLAVPLASQGAQVTVVDVSIDALSTLMRRAAEAGVSERVSAVQGEAESLSDLVPAAGFDLVLAHEVLHNVSDVPAGVAQLAKALRPGGLLSITMANRVAGVIARALAGDVSGALRAEQDQDSGAHDGAGVISACQASGLQVETIEGLGVFTEMVPGIALERPGNATALIELEAAVASVAPYRDIASRLHIIARRQSE